MVWIPEDRHPITSESLPPVPFPVPDQRRNHDTSSSRRCQTSTTRYHTYGQFTGLNQTTYQDEIARAPFIHRTGENIWDFSSVLLADVWEVDWIFVWPLHHRLICRVWKIHWLTEWLRDWLSDWLTKRRSNRQTYVVGQTATMFLPDSTVVLIFAVKMMDHFPNVSLNNNGASMHRLRVR